MFTKKHFETIAKIISETESEKVKNQLYRRFSEEFKKSNDRFNKQLFKKACGI